MEARKPRRGSMIHYSRRGAQYASIAYRQILADRDITIGMSRLGNPFDNAKAESIMKALKAEEVDGKVFSDISDERRRIDSFIADVYNKEGLHSTPGCRSPLGSRGSNWRFLPWESTADRPLPGRRGGRRPALDILQPA